MSVVLTIAGFDPSSGAGITADLAVFAAHGLFGTSAITALTVQSTVEVRSVQPVPSALLRETLQTLHSDLPAAGIKIGMLGSSGCVSAVVEFLTSLPREQPRPVIVLDPVLRSTSGRILLDPTGVDLLRDHLLPLVDWATPNLDELAVLSRNPTSKTWTKAQIAARSLDLQNEYPLLGLIVTGGHMDPPDDLFLPSRHLGQPEFWLSGQRVQTSSTHGTGCAFSSAFLSRLVQGREPLAAAQAAKHYVAEAMRRAVPRGAGRGPMNLSWPLKGQEW